MTLKTKLGRKIIAGTVIAGSLFATSAFAAPAWFENLDLTDEQKSALEQAHELRVNGETEEADEVLEDAGIDLEQIKKEIKKHRKHHRSGFRKAIRETLENNDYEAFLEIAEGTPLEDIIESEDDFEMFVEAYELRKEAREIMEELGFPLKKHKRIPNAGDEGLE